MEDDQKYIDAINRLSSSSQHWLEVKKILEENIRAYQELIILIDKKVKEYENDISKLN